ncbi:helix-turn-helix domain-containing protein [Flammeovirga yaeyamensis]|uniref:Helix-turn-helix domain-containing protein n=1 Tax=Flammeovirga yaeyamensis TaxID=367791 RepID=A0AAX1N5V0_9BACT|nr:helix-turn-helix domain-containing protein [Flammeovirga yaeyamensis]MBB3697390.1 addiction module HigA family antidote [Flammeovirga yaeyamensis]NMF36084.1 helix-turn-helix domain-containing protein [Flammeovirga yaeyamensis]QWG02817.1 helix-turn-helix domain-containing protein [Flammeovirga yaeyamensis]
MKKKIEEPNESTLTQSMDVGTEGFNEFQAILLKKAQARNSEQRMNIELLNIKYQMEDYLASNDNDIIPVGNFLKIILKTLKIKQKQFAEYVGLKPSNLSKLISGERPVNYDLALIFGKIFNHSPMLWIEIQAKNELEKLRRTSQNKYSSYSINDLVEYKKVI